MKNIFTPRLAFVTVAVLLAALNRILPHPDNFTAIGGMALFAGACIPNRWLSLVLPLTIMLITDAIIGFHNTMWAVYLSFAFITMLGWAMKNRQNVFTFIGFSLAASVIFFLITNAAMWVVGFYTNEPLLYPTTIDGLPKAIMAGIPFFDKTLYSQLLYGGILFGAYHLVRTWKPTLVKA